MTELKSANDDLQTRAQIAEAQSLAGTHQVDRRLQKAGAVEAEVAACDEASPKSVTLVGSCSPDKLGKSGAKLLAGVRDLKGESSLDVVAEQAPLERVVNSPATGTTVGEEPTMRTLRGFLRDDDAAGIIGIYGPGGSGKSTLLRKLNDELLSSAEWGFHLLVLVVVSNGDQGNAAGDIDKLQQAIGMRLELTWQENETKRSRAEKVFHALEDKRFALLLDDVRKAVDLELAGVPLPSKSNRCKVVLTTRSEGVCSDMGAHHKVEVKWDGVEAVWKRLTNRKVCKLPRRPPATIQDFDNKGTP